MHPSVPLIIWLATVVLIQFVSYPALMFIAIGALLTRSTVISGAQSYIWRARWLLSVLWLVLAFNTPGEPFQGISWAPTYEGIAEAGIQVVRLLVTLVCLAWLFSVLSRERLLIGLSGLLMPLQASGIKVSGLLVRLSLVLENLQVPIERGAWRRMLLEPITDCSSRTMISFTMPPWRLRDGAALLGFALIIAGGVFW